MSFYFIFHTETKSVIPVSPTSEKEYSDEEYVPSEIYSSSHSETETISEYTEVNSDDLGRDMLVKDVEISDVPTIHTRVPSSVSVNIFISHAKPISYFESWVHI